MCLRDYISQLAEGCGVARRSRWEKGTSYLEVFRYEVTTRLLATNTRLALTVITKVLPKTLCISNKTMHKFNLNKKSNRLDILFYENKHKDRNI